MKETAKERREKVIERYAHDFYSYISIGIDMSEPTILKMFEKFLTEIHIADSPQGPEDVELPKEKKYIGDYCREGTHNLCKEMRCECECPIKKEKIEEIKGWEALRVAHSESIDIELLDKINEVVRRVNEGI